MDTYEKKYNEILAWAKKYKARLNGVPIEEIFPELRESEDERIRKALILHLQAFYSNEVVAPGISKEMAIAYLEKQKENPKNADSIPADCVSSAKCEDRSPKHSDSDGIDIRDTPAYWRGWDDAMKQKEQKPAEVDESTKRLNDNWMKQHFEDYEEQKSVEWSEEDESFLDSIEEAIHSYYDLNHAPQYDYWLEEKLKSLRPSWKPSEEQMNCLCAAVDAAIRKHNESVSGYKPARVLKSLYEQLQKL